MKFFAILFFVVSTSLIVEARSERRFVVVGVSGYKTGRPPESRLDIFSNQLCKTCEESGVWTNLPKDSPAIAARVFLAHTLAADEVEKLMGLFRSKEGAGCRSNLGLIIMANSWGSEPAAHLAETYFKTCGARADFFVLIDGIQKLSVYAFARPVIAERCLNFYQTRDYLHGGPIPNCENHDWLAEHPARPRSAHVWVEWEGSAAARDRVDAFLRSKR